MPSFVRASLVKWKLPSPYPTTSFGVIITDGSSTVVTYTNSSLLSLVLKTSITLSAKTFFDPSGGGLWLIKYTKSADGSVSNGTTSKPCTANGTEEGKPTTFRRVTLDVAGSYVAT